MVRSTIAAMVVGLGWYVYDGSKSKEDVVVSTESRIISVPTTVDPFNQWLYGICKETIILQDIDTNISLNNQNIQCFTFFKHYIDNGTYTKIIVTGWASLDGDPNKRVDLAKARAIDIRDKLVQLGIPEDKIVVKYMEDPNQQCPWLSESSDLLIPIDPKSPSGLINSRSVQITGV